MTATHPLYRLKLAILVVTCVHCALLITTGAIAIVLRQRNVGIFSYAVGRGSGSLGDGGFPNGIPIGPTLPAAVLVLVFYVGLAFSLPQVAVCGLLVARSALPSRGVLISFIFLNVLLLLVSGVGAGFYTALLNVPATFDSGDSSGEVYTGPLVSLNSGNCISSDGVAITADVCQAAEDARRLAVADFVLAWLTVLVALVMCIMAVVLLVRMLRARRAQRLEEEQQPAMSNMYAQMPVSNGGYAPVHTSDAYAQQPAASSNGYATAQPATSNGYPQQAAASGASYASAQPGMGNGYAQQASTPNGAYASMQQPASDSSYSQQHQLQQTSGNSYPQQQTSGSTYPQQHGSGSTYPQQQQASGSAYPQQQASGSSHKGKQAVRSTDFQQQQAGGSSYRQQDASGGTYPQQHAGGSAFAI